MPPWSSEPWKELGGGPGSREVTSLPVWGLPSSQPFPSRLPEGHYTCHLIANPGPQPTVSSPPKPFPRPLLAAPRTM